MTVLKVAACGFALALVAGCSGAPKESDTTKSADTSVVETPVASVAYASLKGDAVHGQAVFARCMACHAVDAGKNLIGPSLHGVVGSAAGKAAGYTYSDAMKAGKVVWTEDKLYEFLEHPMKTVPGTKMSFVGLSVPQDRADVIAYVKAH